jgi:hypothetical protein
MAGESPAVIQVDALEKAVTEDVVAVEYRVILATAGPTYLLLIDLDNEGGFYKHTATGSIQALAASAQLSKTKAGDQWEVDIGVVLAINASEATLGFLEGGALSASDTSTFRAQNRNTLFPVTLSLKVVSGDFDKIATNFKQTNGDLTTSTLIDDIGGVGRVPAVGDVVIKVVRSSGNGAAAIFYTIGYRTVS